MVQIVLLTSLLLTASANGFGRKMGVTAFPARKTDLAAGGMSSLETHANSQLEDGSRVRGISEALLSMVGGRPSDYDNFLDNIWQKTPHVFRTTPNKCNEKNAFHNQVNMGIPGLIRVLTQGCELFRSPNASPDWHKTLPMVFDAKQTALEVQQLASIYGGGPDGSEVSEPLFAAYLDGASVVLNHCDRLCPHTAALCEDLQNAFPVCYANAYLTPPASQTVPPHADDRDVFVVQVHGEKTWRVYKEVPIPYPYPHEQVGKNGLPVPDRVLRGGLAVETVLRPGDVLYIPRGYVHEASTRRNQGSANISPSYHVTVALATFDWSLADMLAMATKKTLDDIPAYRKAMPLDLGAPERPDGTAGPTRSTARAFETQIEQALDMVKQEWTADVIDDYLRQKYEWHRSLSRPERIACIEEGKIEEMQRAGSLVSDNSDGAGPRAAVGVEAAKRLRHMSSIVRTSTPEEQEYVSLNNGPLPQGRQQRLRDETRVALEYIKETLRTMGPTHKMELSQLPSLLKEPCPYICNLTLISYVRRCVECGEIATD